MNETSLVAANILYTATAVEEVQCAVESTAPALHMEKKDGLAPTKSKTHDPSILGLMTGTVSSIL
ncbi:uncharacterized protein GLRG_03178 [Colletotrichum graminicola M1.001]|uniref:Uncharacterized protein n=1 Tax=Colletotrichum graminicola (strain M1.001 / M2 / FGSC 10212) TaxID=645133 RepID=E3QAZ6_COLGM|nr:uncharacterized protein GLRG_03178 [Colletotrichum graminicola M1.001]EFQ28034.1 hypothetical protein GLRG_03178 [Colletotrichum graminicola M1.001]